jgi:hypothetical protein
MSKADKPEDEIDWSLTTWEGSRREELRRWAQLPLEQIIKALEEMQELASISEKPEQFAQHSQQAIGSNVAESNGTYIAGTEPGNTKASPGKKR